MSDLTPAQQAAYDRLYGDAPEPAQESTKPGVFAGWYKAAAGIPGGASGAVLSVASSATDEQVAPDESLFSPKDILNPIIHPSIEQARQSAADYYRPDPQTTGWVGNTLYGVSDVLTRATIGNVIAPGAGLPLAAGTTGFERAKDMEAQGVDANTAAVSGAIQGGSLLAAGGLSSIGTSQVSRILSGAGLNIAFGSGSRALDSAVLRANGYEAQAAQQEWNDASAMIADGIIGAAFHILPHAREVPKPSAEEVDAALAARNGQSVAAASPGVPADPASAGAHVDALDLAHDQLTDGRDVDVAPVVRDATFVPREADPEAPPVAVAVEEALRNEGVPSDAIASSKPDEQVTSDMTKKLADHSSAVAEYSQLQDSMGGRVLNTDVARELSPDYLADRTRSAPVHEPASQFVKRLYAEKLAKPTPEGLDNTVMFTAGGTGAGKTTGLDAAIGKAGTNPEIIYDTNMNTLASAEQKIKQALDAGRKVHILYVYRDPVDALVNGALPRAERQALRHGTGRTVPLGEHAKTHLGVRGVIDALAEKYRGDDRVRIDAYDNSHGRGNGRFAALEDIPRIDENGLHERLQAALDQEHRAGRISDQTRAGFRAAGRESTGAKLGGHLESQGSAGARGRSGDAPARGAGQQNTGAVGRDATARDSQAGARSSEIISPDVTDTPSAAGEAGANRRAGEAGRENVGRDASAKSGAGIDPARVADVDRARAIVEQAPDVQLDDGTTAADAMRSADEEVQQAEKTGSAIQAAVACFLRFGSEL